MSRGQNELIGEFKMAAGDVNSINRVGYERHEHMINAVSNNLFLLVYQIGGKIQ